MDGYLWPEATEFLSSGHASCYCGRSILKTETRAESLHRAHSPEQIMGNWGVFMGNLNDQMARGVCDGLRSFSLLLEAGEQHPVPQEKGISST